MDEDCLETAQDGLGRSGTAWDGLGQHRGYHRMKKSHRGSLPTNPEAYGIDGEAVGVNRTTNWADFNSAIFLVMFKKFAEVTCASG